LTHPRPSRRNRACAAVRRQGGTLPVRPAAADYAGGPRTSAAHSARPYVARSRALRRPQPAQRAPHLGSGDRR
jgi:hypothetical protein